LREFQDVTIGAAVASEPNKAFVVDIDAVLVLEPVVALSRSAPRTQQVSFLIEFQHRRCRLAALGARRIEARRLLVVGETAWTLNDPDMILRVDRDAGGLAHDPVVRQRLRPKRIDLEMRYLGGLRRGGENNSRKCPGDDPHDVP
jgi:hypothetical protein